MGNACGAIVVTRHGCANFMGYHDEVLEFNGLCVYVDAMSKLYLDEVSIDYVDSLSESGFKITNPNAKSSCGCGNSFEA